MSLSSSRRFTSLLLFGASALSTSLIAAPLPRSTPESQGVSSRALRQFIDAADKVESMHSFMMLRHGHVVAEAWWRPFRPAYRHKLFSLSKSFASTAVGIAVREGKMSLNDPVISFFPDLAPSEPTWQLKAMRVRDLLAMSTGHVPEDLRAFSFHSEESLAKAFLALPVKYKPGTHFLYNTPATYMCSAIVQKVTGDNLIDYLTPRLFEPLGIEGPIWQRCSEGVALGGYGLNVRTEDIAKLGQLYLQRGEWGGQRILSEEWVTAATSKQSSNGSNPDGDWDQGYGYQFWKCRHGAYRGDGLYGQFCIVLPEHDTVIAITAGAPNMQGTLNLVWEHLLPGLAPVALPENNRAQRRLTERLRTLTLPLPDGQPGPALVEAQRNRIYQFTQNEYGLESLQLRPLKGEGQLVLTIHGEKNHWSYGYKRQWSINKTRVGPNFMKGFLRLSADTPHPIATAGAWPQEDTLLIKSWYTRGPYALTLKLLFKDDAVAVTPAWNVTVGSQKIPTLHGSLAVPEGTPSP